MKILFCIPRMNNGGAERVIANLANGMVNIHEIEIVSFTGHDSYYPLNEKVQFKSANLKLNRKSSIKRKFSMLYQVMRAISFFDKECEKFQPDTVVSFLAAADLVSYLLRKRYRYNWVSSERCDPNRRKKIIQFFLKKIYQSVDLFVCQSSYISNYYINIPSDRKIVIPNPLGKAVLGKLKEEGATIKIVSVGRLAQQKNYELLIRAFYRVKQEITTEMSLIIYGDGPQREYLESIIRELNLEGMIRLPGSDKDVLEKIGDASLYVMSSDFEGFPNALLEAMAIGIPVIATDVATGTVRELVTERTGLIVPANNEGELAKAIKYMVKNEGVRMSIRGRQGENIWNRYRTERIVESWENAINKIQKKRVIRGFYVKNSDKNFQ